MVIVTLGEFVSFSVNIHKMLTDLRSWDVESEGKSFVNFGDKVQKEWGFSC
jgi:hypothetical protein